MGDAPGKLRAAARWLFDDSGRRAAGDDIERADQLRQLGVDEAQIAAQLLIDQADDDGAEDLELWAWHLDALKLLDGMSTQWLTEMVMGREVWRLGLNYTALPIVEQRKGVTCTPATFWHLQVMEREAARVLNDA